MLKTLTQNFSDIIKKARGQGRLSEDNIRAAMAEMRTAMLDADVALPVVTDFLQSVQDDAIGARVDSSVNPGQAFSAIVHRQLTVLMGGDNAALQLKKSPAVILACGLQGVGKTTNLAKIAKRLMARGKKRVLLGSADIHRPAAIEQLQTLAATIGASFATSAEMTDAVARTADMVNAARRQLADVLLLDTAGRTSVDEEMMNEICRLAAVAKPSEILFFVDAMQGQDAVNTARRFHESLPLTGIVLTKFDGDARGGAALSARAVIGAPIKFVGIGEKPDDLQDFHPARFASRILGLGDLATLAEQAVEKTDLAVMHKLGKKIKKNNSFDLNDQLAQMRQIKKVGGVSALADKLPAGVADKMRGADDNEKKMRQLEAVICAMTPQERTLPDIIKASRKRRIAAGAGVQVQMVNQLLAQHEQTRKMMKQLAKNPAGLARMMRGMLG